MKRLSIVVLCVCVFGLIIDAGADNIYLKNGRMIGGVVVKEDNEKVVIRSFLGETAYDRKEIMSIEKTKTKATKKVDDKLSVDESKDAKAKEAPSEPEGVQTKGENINKATSENYNKIKSNMSLEEVKTILGAPAKILENGLYLWTKNDLSEEYKIKITDGKVVYKTSVEPASKK